MCMEDVRIGRRSRTATKVVDVGSASWVKVADQSPSRVTLSLRSRGNVGHLVIPWVNGTPPNATSTGNNQSQDETFDIQQHGDMVTQPWWAWQSAGNLQVWVTEVFLDAE